MSGPQPDLRGESEYEGGVVRFPVPPSGEGKLEKIADCPGSGEMHVAAPSFARAQLLKAICVRSDVDRVAKS